MTDRRTEIPTWAFLNMQIAQLAVRTNDFQSCVRAIEERYSLPADSLRYINLGYAVSGLYCLIVVPKELWLRDQSDPIFSELNDSWWPHSGVRVDLCRPNFQENPVFYFIRALRNAISHVNFEIADNGDFTFWDQRNAQAPRHFQATLTREVLENLLSTLGAYLANLRTTQGAS